MKINISRDQAYDVVGDLILNDISIFRKKFSKISMAKFMSLSREDQDMYNSELQTLTGLELIAPYYCGDDWELKL